MDDSPTTREFLAQILASDPDIHIAGLASDGEEAMRMIAECKPDIVTMDVVMPGMDGIQTTKAIMESHPLPVVIVSSCYNPGEVELSYRAIEVGAVAILPKPIGLSEVNGKANSEFIKTIKLMSEVSVVKRMAHRRVINGIKPVIENGQYSRDIDIVAIGASTGGPPVLQTILSGLPEDFPTPIVAVQHISLGFIEGMVKWLQPCCRLKVKIAIEGEAVKAGAIYFAPDKRHMGIDRSGRVFLSDAAPEHGVRPSVSFLFRSVIESYGSRAMGILLTGMGRDGAKEMLTMHRSKCVTIAQDKETSVVFGMPGEAVRLRGVTHVLPPDKILNHLLLYCGCALLQKRQGV